MTLDLPAALNPFSAPHKPIKVKGRVTSKGGLQGVVVTDGQSVVSTDQQGYYEMTSHHRREFLYLSLPAGYQIPRQENDSAAFFNKLDKRKEEVSLAFELQPLETRYVLPLGTLL